MFSDFIKKICPPPCDKQTALKKVDALEQLLNQYMQRLAGLEYSVKRIDEGMNSVNRGMQQFATTSQAMAKMGEAGAMVSRSLDKFAGVEKTLEKLDGIEAMLTQQLHNIKQTANLAARQQTVSGRKIKVAFIVYLFESWDSVDLIYKSMKESDDFEPLVISIPRQLPGDNGFIKEDLVDQYLTKAGIPHLRFNMENSFEGLDILKAIAPDYIFVLAPWEDMFPSGYHISEINFARVCYTPYYGMALVEEFEKNQRIDFYRDHPLTRQAHFIFCETAWHKSQYATHCARGDDHVIATGHPKLDALYRYRTTETYWPVKNNKPGSEKNFKIVWAPHHSVDEKWLRFGTFHEIYEDFIGWIAKNPDVEVVFRPHPVLKTALIYNGLATEEQWNNWIARWNALPNTAIYEDGGYGYVFAASDMMVTDGVSFLVEYPIATGKPLVFCERSIHAKFNPYGELAAEYSTRVRNFDEMIKAIQSARDGFYPSKAAEEKRLVEACLPHPGKVAELIMETLALDCGYVRKDSA